MLPLLTPTYVDFFMQPSLSYLGTIVRNDLRVPIPYPKKPFVTPAHASPCFWVRFCTRFPIQRTRKKEVLYRALLARRQNLPCCTLSVGFSRHKSYSLPDLFLWELCLVSQFLRGRKVQVRYNSSSTVVSGRDGGRNAAS